MIDILSPEGRQVLESFCISPSLFAFDYDGTLSEIVDHHEKAVLSEKVIELMRTLCDLAPVALISGRKLADLKTRAPFPSKYLIGNHGLEGLPHSEFSMSNASETCTQWKAQLAHRDLACLGIELEDKSFSLSLHYRNSRMKVKARNALLSWVSELTPAPRIITGKHIVNVVPAGTPHKGLALLELMETEGTRSSIYIGDDNTDEDVFSLQNSQILSIRVGRAEVTAAPYFLESQNLITQLLETMIFYKQELSRHDANI